MRVSDWSSDVVLSDLEGIVRADMAGRKRELDASAAALIGSGRNLARFDTIILQPLIQFGQGVIVQNLVGYIVDAAMVSGADDDRMAIMLVPCLVIGLAVVIATRLDQAQIFAVMLARAVDIENPHAAFASPQNRKTDV